MKKQQGFIPVLLVILVPVIIIGGYFIYQSRQAEPPNSESLARPISNLELDQPPATTETEVNIGSSGSSPQALTVNKGVVVTFTNTDTKTHTLISDQLEFDPEEKLGSGDSMTYTFDTIGTFVYTDKDNPSLKGTVVVK